MKNFIWKKIVLYICVATISFVGLKNGNLYGVERDMADLDIFYKLYWSYTEIAFMYVPLFIFFLMNRTKYFLKTYVICRFIKKQDILFAQIYENIIQAIEMAFVTNITILFFILTAFEGELEIAKVFYVLLCNILAQCFGWIFVGNIYIMFTILSDKVVIGMIATILVVGFILCAHSATFVFKKWFIDLYNQMIIDTYEKQPNQIVVQILKSIVQGIVVFILSLVMFFKKLILGDEAKNEAD